MKNLDLTYCSDRYNYERFKTREVKIGDLILGGSAPIRVQSMTTTDTMDTEGTVAQSIRMIEAGCELVRITAPSLKEAQNLLEIKKQLRSKGYTTPIVADIHFTPNAAELAARIVEKVRINPGNYADKKKFEVIEYTDSAYEAELERIKERFTPLVKTCKEYGTAMRIGTNHGSLSDRILSRYGDTPEGMVESAMEFLRIAESESFYNIVLSMKASNPQVMVQAYRLLVNRMIAAGMNYPLHLGVTEAGEGEDGRIKSAVGIGTLLEDGLGDTVRVSLTEEPEFEIPVAKALVERYSTRRTNKKVAPTDRIQINSFEFQKRKSRNIFQLGGEEVPFVISDFSNENEISPAKLFRVGYNYSVPLDKWNINDSACDMIYTGKNEIEFHIPGTLSVLQDAEIWNSERDRHFPLFNSIESFFSSNKKSVLANFILIDVEKASLKQVQELAQMPVILVLTCSDEHAMPRIRAFFEQLAYYSIDLPCIVRRHYTTLDSELFQLYSATDLGGLLIDGLGDGVWITHGSAGANQKNENKTSFDILQACRARISKTEYISCPSCGRTLFDLQETTAKIRQRTDHLKGVKIGIMGCIVNGPGEMADADFGYVGTGVGKITLYKGKEVVKRNVDAELAVDELIELIKSNGKWVEPSVNEFTLS
jgi:(E)-4-hydroxy-3-methylbut-2-enyl-diphosphate synthase